MAGYQGTVGPSQLATGRLRIQLADEIAKLNIDKAPLIKLLSELGKQKTGGMEYKWLSKERRSDWLTVNSYGGAWAAGANTEGTITIPADEAWMLGEGEILKVPSISDVNIYVDAVNTSTGEITARTYDNTSTINFSSGGTGASKLLNISNTFEMGTGMGTQKSHQPSENFNYIQIIQHPYGVLEEMDHFEYEAGGKEFNELETETLIEHEFSKEKLCFFGRKHKVAAGYMEGKYPQYFTGGLIEAVSSNVDTQADLTKKEFAAWVNKCLYYAKKPVIFAGSLIFEALSWWLGQTLKTEQNEKTLGIAVSTYMTQYGDLVKVIPHRELLKNDYAGYAFCVDLSDIKYYYLDGLDTHLEVEIQQRDLKQKINEYRTWFGVWIGNEKRHGMLKGVETISA